MSRSGALYAGIRDYREVTLGAPILTESPLRRVRRRSNIHRAACSAAPAESHWSRMGDAPPFFSSDFHLRFLPSVIRQRLRPAPPRSGFVSSAVLEFSLLTVVCGVMLAIGVPAMVSAQPTILGGVLTLLGGGGLLAMLVISLRSAWGEPLRYERFEPAVFLFVIVLGATVGIWTGFFLYDDRGSLFHYSHATERWLLALAGTALGYFAGIAVALWVQKLGPLTGMVVVWAVPGLVGLVVTDLVILST